MYAPAPAMNYPVLPLSTGWWPPSRWPGSCWPAPGGRCTSPRWCSPSSASSSSPPSPTCWPSPRPRARRCSASGWAASCPPAFWWSGAHHQIFLWALLIFSPMCSVQLGVQTLPLLLSGELFPADVRATCKVRTKYCNTEQKKLDISTVWVLAHHKSTKISNS